MEWVACAARSQRDAAAALGVRPINGLSPRRLPGSYACRQSAHTALILHCCAQLQLSCGLFSTGGCSLRGDLRRKAPAQPQQPASTMNWCQNCRTTMVPHHPTTTCIYACNVHYAWQAAGHERAPADPAANGCRILGVRSDHESPRRPPHTSFTPFHRPGYKLRWPLPVLSSRWCSYVLVGSAHEHEEYA